MLHKESGSSCESALSWQSDFHGICKVAFIYPLKANEFQLCFHGIIYIDLRAGRRFLWLLGQQVHSLNLMLRHVPNTLWLVIFNIIRGGHTFLSSIICLQLSENSKSEKLCTALIQHKAHWFVDLGWILNQPLLFCQKNFNKWSAGFLSYTIFGVRFPYAKHTHINSAAAAESTHTQAPVHKLCMIHIQLARSHTAHVLHTCMWAHQPAGLQACHFFIPSHPTFNQISEAWRWSAKVLGAPTAFEHSRDCQRASPARPAGPALGQWTGQREALAEQAARLLDWQWRFYVNLSP